MIPFTGVHYFVDLLTLGKSLPQTLNADYAWHLSNPPAPVAVSAPDAWPLRLLPAFLRTPLKARIAARKYEQVLIAMWDNAPHLLDDIGVMLAPADGMADHLVAAPARVIAHARAHGLIQPPQVAATQSRPAMAPAPRTAATVQRPNTDRLPMQQAGIAA